MTMFSEWSRQAHLVKIDTSTATGSVWETCLEIIIIVFAVLLVPLYSYLVIGIIMYYYSFLECLILIGKSRHSNVFYSEITISKTNTRCVEIHRSFLPIIGSDYLLIY